MAKKLEKMKLNEEMQFKVFQEMSGNFLCDNIPDNWEDMKDNEQEDFLTNHAWEPLEDMSADNIFENIESATASMVEFIEKNL
jgi:hypothetical protein